MTETQERPLPATPDHDVTLRVLSYNICHGRGMDERVDLRRVAGVMVRIDPDLVALQEVDQGCRRSGQVRQAEELARLLSMQCAFGKTLDHDGGEYGLAVLSRFPIQESRCHPLPCGHEPRCALEVVVQLKEGGALVHFVSVHAAYMDALDRLEQAGALNALFGNAAESMVVAGDFNALPDSPPLVYLKEKGWRVARKEGRPETFPADAPDREIDFVMTPEESPATVTACWVDEEALASDHRPVVAHVSVPRMA